MTIDPGKESAELEPRYSTLGELIEGYLDGAAMTDDPAVRTMHLAIAAGIGVAATQIAAMHWEDEA